MHGRLQVALLLGACFGVLLLLLGCVLMRRQPRKRRDLEEEDGELSRPNAEQGRGQRGGWCTGGVARHALRLGCGFWA